MEEEKLLDEYIQRTCSYYDELSEEDKQIERKIISESLGYASYCVNIAWNCFVKELIESIPAPIKKILRI